MIENGVNCKILWAPSMHQIVHHEVIRGISYDKGYIWSSTIIKGHTARKKKNVEERDNRENGKKQMD